jgi:hypothetical protein
VVVTYGTNQNDAYDVAVYGGNVYWTLGGGAAIVSSPKAGGTPTTLLSIGAGAGYLTGIVATSDGIYFTNCGDGQSSCNNGSGPAGGSVMSLAYGATTPATLASSQGSPYELVVSNGVVYWTAYSDGNVMSVPVGGGKPTTLASEQQGPWGIAVDATNVYWATTLSGQIMKRVLP